MEEQDGDHKFFRQEKTMEKNFDKLASDMSQMYLGDKKVDWLTITRYVLLVYLVLVAFSSFYRPDFMSLTAVTLGIMGVE